MTSQQARGVLGHSPGEGEIRDETLPAPAQSDAVVRTLYLGHQPRHRVAGLLRDVCRPANAQRMRAPFQAGISRRRSSTATATSGEVETGPGELRRPRRCSRCFRTRRGYVVPAAAVHPLPDDVPPARAVLAANLETAINGVWDARARSLAIASP